MQQKIVFNDFTIQKINPFTNKEYDDTWVYVEVNDSEDYFILDKTDHNLFQAFISKKCVDWTWRLMDFISYELEYGKNIIVKIDKQDYEKAEKQYEGHCYKDNYIREYETNVLVHSTPRKNYENIIRTGRLKSWNKLKASNEIEETEPIGKLLGDHEEYRDYIMLSEGGVAGEIVVNSKNHNELKMDINSEYEPGARLYFDASKIAENGLLVRDGLHYKIKDELPLEGYLIWTATKDNIDMVDGVYTPRNFVNTADIKFRERYGDKLGK